jgi:hypothetical protein
MSTNQLDKTNLLRDLASAELSMVTAIKWSAFEAVLQADNPELFEKYKDKFIELRDNHEGLKQLKSLKEQVENAMNN